MTITAGFPVSIKSANRGSCSDEHSLMGAQGLSNNVHYGLHSPVIHKACEGLEWALPNGATC